MELGERLRTAAGAAVPRLEGEIRAPGLRGRVDVLRDRWGVPHIYAERLTDLFFAQGLVVGSERLFQIEAARRLGLGRLSELLGEPALALDRFVRALGWNRTARRMATGWDDRSREMSAAYNAGIRAWAEMMPAPPVEYVFLDAEPWVPTGPEAATADAAAAVFLAWTLSRGWDADLLRAEVAERLGLEAMRVLFPDPEPVPAPVQAGKLGGDAARLLLLEQAVLPPPGQGSNAWVVGPRRSATGRPLLANDPHLATQLPPAWFEVHLSAPGYDVAGVALPFSPGVVAGHNRRIAWGVTNSEGDIQDLFLERLSEHGTSAAFRQGWEPVQRHREEIRVRYRDEPVVVEARETRHGPLVDSYTIGIGAPTVVEGGIRRSYALSWVGFAHAIQPSAVWRLNVAEDWATFREAARHWTCPGQAMVYADVDGNIGFQVTGIYPLRRSHDGTLPVPGWTGDYEWRGEIPFEDLPHAYNPSEAFIVTANNRPHDDAYPHLLGRDFLPPFRARRIAQLLAEERLHDRGSFARIQVDTVSLSAREVAPSLAAIEPADERQKTALALLREWDGDLAADSAAGALYQAWAARIARDVLQPLLGDELFTHLYLRRQSGNGFLHRMLPNLLAHPSETWFGTDGAHARDERLRRALDEALDELSDHFGEEPWRWGAMHRVRFAGRLALIPGLDDLFTAGVVELGGDDQTVLQGLFEPGLPYDAAVVPSWRHILDPGDWDASLGVLTTGQSGHAASPHFRDQLELWARGEHHPMPFSRRAVEEATQTRFALTP